MLNKKFTLIELIVSTIVISILALIVIFSINNAREDAETSALKANVSELQTASEIYSSKNNEDIASVSKVSFGNPSKIDFKKVDIKKKMKSGKGYYWIDSYGTVWGSFSDLPSKVSFNKDTREFKFTAPKNAKYCVVHSYDSENKFVKKERIATKGDTPYMVVIDVNLSPYVSCSDKFENETPLVNETLGKENKTDIFDENIVINNVDENVVVLKSHKLVNGIFEIGTSLDSELVVQNKSNQGTTFFLGYSFEGDNGSFYDVDSKEVTFQPHEVKTITASWDSSNTTVEGFYNVYISLKDSSHNRKVYLKAEDTVYLFKDFNKWRYLTQNDWNKVDQRLISQISLLEAQNIKLKEREISIDLPVNSYSSGQTQSIQPFGYGSYEARMKVVDSDSLLSGFFLYNAPDGEHEVDIELLKRSGDWYAWFTVHNINHASYNPSNGLEPGEAFKKEVKLNFDPSVDFHNYRINAYPKYVSFEIDGKEMARWNESIDFMKMHLYTSTFYPHWLTRTQLSEDQSTKIEWVRTGYFE